MEISIILFVYNINKHALVVIIMRTIKMIVVTADVDDLPSYVAMIIIIVVVNVYMF